MIKHHINDKLSELWNKEDSSTLLISPQKKSSWKQRELGLCLNF